MASYNGSIDLLALNGAQVMTGVDQKKPQRAYVCIPVDFNEIKLTVSRNDPSKQIAGLRVNIWPLNENYKNAVRRSAQERGDANVNVPTHEMQMSYSTDYVKYIAAQAPGIVEQVKQQNKDRDPGIVTQNVQDESSHLFKAFRSRMNKRLAMLYQPQQQAAPSTTPQPNYQTAGAATAYAPSAEQDDAYAFGSNFNEDELPF